MRQFESSVALISSGAGGIGAATASLLMERGATVVIGDLREPGPGSFQGASRPEFTVLDVTSEKSWKQAVGDIVKRYGKLDVLVNAAGIVGDVVAGSLEQTTLADWHKVMAVNLDGTFLGCREAALVMGTQERGAIVNVSSLGAYYPTVQSVAYGASKGAVTQLTKSVALFGSENGRRIRCNSVHPGRTATPMLQSIADQMVERRAQTGTTLVASSASRIPLGPAGTPEDAARLIAFLASREADYITGAEFVVDGGWSLLR